MCKEKAKFCIACEMCSKLSFRCSCTGALRIRQFPRVVAVKTKQTVHITCPTTANTVQWYRLNKYEEDLSKAAEVKKGGKTDISTPGTMLTISNMRVEDTGVYFCKVNDTWGSGTELRIASKGAAGSAASLMSANVATNWLSSSPRTWQPSQVSVQDTDEGRSHHPPGSVAGCVYRCSDATQTSAGEEGALKGPLLHSGVTQKEKSTQFL